MQTIVEKNQLVRAISTVSKAVSSQPVIPLLGSILFSAENGRTRLAATNIELGVICDIQSDGDLFNVCVPAKTFTDLMNAIYSDNVTITMNDNEQAITIETDTSETNVKCMAADDFPPIPRAENPNFMMSVVQFKEMVNRVAFAAKKGDSQSPLSGVLLEIQTINFEAGGKIKPQSRFVMFATDGYHISFEETRQLMGKNKREMKVIVRGDMLELVSRLLPSEGILSIEVTENKAMFQCEDVSIVTQVMGVDFPDYDLVAGVIPNEYNTKTTVTVNTLDLLRACKQLKVFATETSKTKMEIGGVIIKYSILTQNRGGSVVEIVGICNGDEITVGINVHYLYSFLEVCKTPQVVIQFKDNRSAIRLSMKEYDDYYHVIMPIAL